MMCVGVGTINVADFIYINWCRTLLNLPTPSSCIVSDCTVKELVFLIVQSSRLPLVLDETADEGEATKDSGDKENIVNVDPGEGMSDFIFRLLLDFERFET
jgi:hypothetical protein